MGSITNKVLAIFVILLLTLIMGVFTGIKNSSDYQISSFEFEEINSNVYVYRDNNFVPTIIAENSDDLFFAQGYEMARDRLWQLELYRSVANGEISRLFGNSQLDSDKYLRTLSMKIAASQALEKLTQEEISIIERFVEGINKYIELHKYNLPLEFTLLDVAPKEWTVTDALAIQGVLSRQLSIAALEREFRRNSLAADFGPEKALELLPMDDPIAESYYLSLNSSDLAPLESFSLEVSEFLGLFDLQALDGSNNWVVGPDRSSTGNAILANDPHLSLSTPSIWWQVHLVSPEFHVQGFALPGVPGIIIGHNEDVSWGFTNTGLDALDMYYFKVNDQGEYFIDGDWKEFTVVNHEIGESGNQQDYQVRYTDYGPVLDPSVFSIPEDVTDHVYVMRWTYLENFEQDLVFRAIFEMNKAQNEQEFLNALQYFGVPGQNIVYVTVDGEFGYQFTGIIPIRNIPGSGVIPQNGSDSRFGWNGTVPYLDQYRVDDLPSDSFFSTANEKVDPRDNFYITDHYALPYRSGRIEQRLSADTSISIEDMQSIQDDTYNLYAELLLDEVLPEIRDTDYVGDNENRLDEALEAITEWNNKMDRDSRGATVFALFRLFFEHETFRDEFSQAETISYLKYAMNADHGLSNIVTDENSEWFDDITTSNTENRADIVERAFIRTVDYLVEEISRLPSNWEWGDVHEVVFEHAFGDNLFGAFNEGNKGSDGSEHTVKAAGGTPRFDDDGNVDLTQEHGSSFRYVSEATSSWTNVYGMIAPGQSEHYFVGQRSNTVDDWIEGNNFQWYFYKNYDNIEPVFTYIKV